MSYDRTYRKTTTTTRANNNNARSNRRVHFAPSPPPGSYSRQHSVLGYWVPLITIGTIAVGGLAAWIWSERSEHDDHYPDNKPPRPPTGMDESYSTQGAQSYPRPAAAGLSMQEPPGQGMPPPVGAQQTSYSGEAASYYSTQTREIERNDQTFLSRMGGVMRRTPSPQQFFDSASKQVSAGLAAAGSALGSIMEVDSNHDEYEERRGARTSPHDEREGFSDHERWSEEAEEKQRVTGIQNESVKRANNAKSAREEKGKVKAKRAVAIVVSADVDIDDNAYEGAYHTEHGSILAHLPSQHDPSKADIFILIYAPGLKSLPSTNCQPGRAPSTLGSSYSEINTPAHTPGSEMQSMSPRIDAADLNTKQFEALYNQALALVSHPTQIMPFTTADGYVHILRHLAPQLVYLSDVLSGKEGDTIAQLKGWVGHTVLVVGDEGHGGLADTETETEDERGERKQVRRWWEHSSFVGLGKEVDVVDAARVGDDWSKRIGGRE